MAGIIDLANDHMSGDLVWGKRDCCTGACDIFLELHGVDPMRSLRGLYTTKHEAYREIMKRGGWLKMTSDFAASVSLVEGCGSFGEIGLTRQGVVMYSQGRALAISAGDLGWVIRTETGYVISKDDVIERSWAWVS